ncbi:hypothetical protein K461DRAFT_321766 [Myriangium duriaei CBS 260.36]|uniref:N-acetyltransferase domain-containing protein n=1 Tax=Myriangium duriaei CBS 260.36 TaxID=1168546 RepID=A0A9P4J1F4_9PEZI|nr:hypothetical protein K461DRAFT_321766 [Myriangium duriaei CBS 260.36]
MPVFHLSRATPKDMDEMIHIIGALAEEDTNIRERAIGPNTAEQRERNTKAFQMMMTKDPTQIWLKVTELTTGKIVAGSMWRLDPAVAPKITLESWPRPWLDNDLQMKKRVMQWTEEIFAIKKQLFIQPQLMLGMMFTARESRRQGAGTLMMQWGCDLADHLFLPIWLTTTPTGRYLYERFGFKIHYKGHVSEPFMKREAESR